MIRTTSRALGAILAASLLFAGCGGGGHSSIPQAPSQSSNNSTGGSGSGTQAFVYGQQLISQLSYVGPAKAATGLSIPVLVQMQNPQGLIAYAKAASDPTSGTYRQWLTPAQIADDYGATPANYAAAANYLRSFGLQVAGWPQREMLTVSGSTGQFAKAFSTTFATYTFAGKQIVAANSAAHVPSTVPIAVAPLIGAPMHRSFLIKLNSSNFYGYSPQQIATGFDYSGAFGRGYSGFGINVGIIGTGPILGTDGKPDDLLALAYYFNASIGNLTQVAASPQPATTANGHTGTGATDNNPTNMSTPPPVTAPCTIPAFPTPNNYNTCNPEDGEAEIDTQSVATLAPGSNVLFYIAYNSNEFCVTGGGTIDPTPPVGPTCPAGETPYPIEAIGPSFDLVDDEIQQAIADNKADAISMSFGLQENYEIASGYIAPSGSPPGLGQIEMASMVAEGMAVFASSGDNGAYECFDPNTGAPLGIACVNYPASDPNVVAVGGVNIPLDQAGNLTGTITAWADNTTQGGDGTFSNNVGSGGGVSADFTAPAWQAAALGISMRELPDWSLEADPVTGPAFFVNVAFGYPPVAYGGTSVAAPESAAMWALVLQACKASTTCNKGGAHGYRLGNPAPLAYAIYAKSNPLADTYAPSGFTPQLGYSNVFYDILYGDNQPVPAQPGPAQTPIGYNAGPGYDQVTGVGAPFAGHLIQAVTGTQVP